MTNEQAVYQVLTELEISYKKYEHEPIFTVEQGAEFERNLVGGHSKNLFLRDAKATQYFLVVVEAHKRVDLKALQKELDVKKLSFGSPEKLQELLGVTPGSVSLLAIMNDRNANAVKLYIDADLWAQDPINFHPNINTATLGIARADLEKFLAWTKHPYEIITVPAVLSGP